MLLVCDSEFLRLNFAVLVTRILSKDVSDNSFTSQLHSSCEDKIITESNLIQFKYQFEHYTVISFYYNNNKYITPRRRFRLYLASYKSSLVNFASESFYSQATLGCRSKKHCSNKSEYFTYNKLQIEMNNKYHQVWAMLNVTTSATAKVLILYILDTITWLIDKNCMLLKLVNH